MPRLLNAETDLKEIESILLKSHWLESFRKKKLLIILMSQILLYMKMLTDLELFILHLMSHILKEKNHLEKVVVVICLLNNFLLIFISLYIEI